MKAIPMIPNRLKGLTYEKDGTREKISPAKAIAKALKPKKKNKIRPIVEEVENASSIRKTRKA